MFRRISAVEAAPLIQEAAGEYLDDILAEIEAGGTCEAFDIDQGKACAVTRIEGTELVVVCFEGENIRRYSRALIDLARRAGLKSIRAHTDIPALWRWYKRLGMFEAERVYRLEL